MGCDLWPFSVLRIVLLSVSITDSGTRKTHGIEMYRMLNMYHCLNCIIGLYKYMNVLSILKKNKSAILGSRAVSVTDVRHTIRMDIVENYMDYEIVDLFFDDIQGTQERYAILMDITDRQLYRLDFVLADNTILYPTPLQPVSIEFMGMQRVSAVNTESSDMILLVQSANAIPTRDGHHDVSTLLRSFVNMEDSTGLRPLVDVFHNNEPIGRVVDSYIAEDGYSLFDLVVLEECETSRFIYNQIKSGKRKWGASNEFIATRKYTEVIDGENVKVLDGGGVRYFVSLLPENMVANYETMTKIVQTKDHNNMSKTLEGLLQHVSDLNADEDLLDEIESLIKARTDEIALHENKRSADVAEPVAEVEGTAEDAVESTETTEPETTEPVAEVDEDDISESDEPVAEIEVNEEPLTDFVDEITEEDLSQLFDGYATRDELNALTSKLDEVLGLQVELADTRAENAELRSMIGEKETKIQSLQSGLDTLAGHVKQLRAIEAFIQGNRSKRQKTAPIAEPVVDVVKEQLEQKQSNKKARKYPENWGRG